MEMIRILCVTKELGLRYACIGAGSGWGALRRETELGPEFVEQSGIIDRLKAEGVDCGWLTTVLPSIRCYEKPDVKPIDTLPYVAPFVADLANKLLGYVNAATCPVIIGGDHSSAIGTWSRVTHEYEAEGEFGLIWFDAHMDAHTPETTLSDAIHGMPLAALLGYGEPALTDLVSPKPKLNPKHVALIGVRSYEEGEAKLLEQLNVRVYKMDEIKERGLFTVFHEAVQIVTTDTKGFGISVDLDGFDPEAAPGVGSPEKDGIFPEDMLPLFTELKGHSQLKAIEIMEFNPKRDIDDKTLDLIYKLLKVLL